VADFCRGNGVELVVVGPEAPLVAGLADALTAAGIKYVLLLLLLMDCFGSAAVQTAACLTAQRQCLQHQYS